MASLDSCYTSHSGCKYLKKKNTRLKPPSNQKILNKGRLPYFKDIIEENETKSNPVGYTTKIDEPKDTLTSLVECLPKGYGIDSSIRTIVLISQSLIKREIQDYLSSIEKIQKHLRERDYVSLEELEEDISLANKCILNLEKTIAKGNNLLLIISKIMTEGSDVYLNESLKNNFQKYYT